MNVDALPVPKLYNAVHESHANTMFKVFGVALIAWWILPWGGFMGRTLMSWDIMGFFTIWALLAGIGMTVLGFVGQIELKPGIKVAIGGGIGLLGLLSVTLGIGMGRGGGGIGAILPFTGFFGLFGLAVTTFGLWLWAKEGFSKLAYFIVIGGLGAMALSLLIPVGGEMPLIMWFKVWGSRMGIMIKIFFFLTFAVYVAIGVLGLLFVVLKGEDAEKGWVNLIGAATFFYLPVTLLILGLMGMFDAGFFLMLMFKMAVVIMIYMWLTLSAATLMFSAMRSPGGLKSMF